MTDEPRVPNEPDSPAASGGASPRQIGTVTRTLHRRRLVGVDFEAEAALLGSVLDRSDEVWSAAAAVSAGDFAWTPYGTVFSAMELLAEQHRSIHPLSVIDELRRGELLDKVALHDRPDLRGVAALEALTAPVPGSWRHARDYAAVVARLAVERRVGVEAEEAVRAIKAGNLDKARDAIEGAAGVLTLGATRTSLGWEDVAAVLRGEEDAVRPSLLRRSDGAALMYAGMTHWLMGEPGKGKTWVALAAQAEVLRSGGVAMMLDWEGNRRVVGSRLRALGVSVEAIESRLLYLRPGVLDKAVTAALAETVRRRQVVVAVLDGVAKALARQGWNEDKAPDVLAWLELVANPLADAGAAVLMLDHVTKDRDGRGLWARGSGAKLGEVSGAAWVVVPRRSFSREQDGRIDLVQAKDREGYIGTDGSVVACVEFRPERRGESLAITVAAPDSAGSFRPTGYMERVSRALETASEALSVRQLRSVVRGRNDVIEAALQCLVDDGYAAREPGRGNALLHRSVKPFRETEEQGQETFDPDREEDREEVF